MGGFATSLTVQSKLHNLFLHEVVGNNNNQQKHI